MEKAIKLSLELKELSFFIWWINESDGGKNDYNTTIIDRKDLNKETNQTKVQTEQKIM